MSFLHYTGKVNEKNSQYLFFMKNKKEPIKSSCVTLVRNPVVDSTFKFVFYKEDIFQDFLNSLLFVDEYEIKKLKFIQNEYPTLSELDERYGRNTNKIDIGALCEIGKKIKEERFIFINQKKNDDLDGTIILIDVEMQIDFSDKKDMERMISYATRLYSEKKAQQVWVVVLAINPYYVTDNVKNKCSKTLFAKKRLPEFVEVSTYDYISIIQIDLNYCKKLLEEGKEIRILSEDNILEANGKEWIKYLTIPLWCKIEDDFHLFPNILEDNFFKNKYVRDAMLKICDKNNKNFKKYSEELNNYKKDMRILDLEKRNKALEKEIIELKNNNKQIQPKKKKKHLRKKKYKYPKDDFDDDEEEEEEDDDEEDRNMDLDSN